MKYPLVEVFDSIQGEGAFAGAPCTFVRFAGCPLHCSFCDTDKQIHLRLSVESVVELCHRHIVVLTGGEPTLHEIGPLARALREDGHRVHLETNGYIQVPYLSYDWVTLSPKKERLPVSWSVDEIKWLVPMWSLEEIIERARQATTRVAVSYNYLQPINGKLTLNMLNVQRCIKMLEVADERGFRLRLSLQIHKIINAK